MGIKCSDLDKQKESFVIKQIIHSFILDRSCLCARSTAILLQGVHWVCSGVARRWPCKVIIFWRFPLKSVAPEKASLRQACCTVRHPCLTRLTALNRLWQLVQTQNQVSDDAANACKRRRPRCWNEETNNIVWRHGMPLFSTCRMHRPENLHQHKSRHVKTNAAISDTWG